MIANGALLFNFFFTLGILISLQASLSLSGIAGMVLTLGIAVDANVLIYERTKEELRAGKGVRQAVKEGYINAFSAIFDSNFTSIITGAILLYFGTGPIKGFATTLIIGITVSFFTAVFMTRVVYEYFLKKDKLQNLSFSTFISKNLLIAPTFRFMSTNKRSLITVSLIVLVCLGALTMRGLSKSIDFTGGRNYTVRFENPIEPEQVRELLFNKLENSNVTVIAIGTDKKTVRISTNYRINDNSDTIDSEIETYLYETLQPLLTNNISLGVFIDRENHTGGSIISSQKVGPSIADDMKTDAIWSVIFAVIAISLYVLFRFRYIAYSIGTVIALSCDTLIVLGVYAFCWGWMPFSMEIDQAFIGAILTVIGYSVNDKVVIFDRVREFLGLYPKRNLRKLFDDSLNTTLSRTINTSMTTLIVLICIFIIAGDSLRSFTFVMIVGITVGTLSSLFVASPIAYYLMNRKRGGSENHAE
jgi:SecD/SecF fusion protein